jgi:chitodextrinase
MAYAGNAGICAAAIAASVLMLSGCPWLPFGGEADTTAPPAVSGLQATPGEAQVTVTWQDPVVADLSHIELSWQPGGRTETVSTGNGSHTVTGLTNGTEYTFSVSAVDTAGNRSATVTVKATPRGVYITYHPNGADTGTVPSDSQAYAPGETVTVFGNTGGLAKADHTFAGWNTQADQGGTSFGTGDTFEAPTQTTTLYAVWNPSYSVQIGFAEPDNPSITFTGTTSEVLRGSDLTVTASTGYAGYTWYLDGASGGTGISSSGAQATIDTTSLWLGTHTVSVVLDEGYSAQVAFKVVE